MEVEWINVCLDHHVYSHKTKEDLLKNPPQLPPQRTIYRHVY